nr:type II toxin-antitoxin system RelE/ParE family toxin [Thiorhodovibrio winogradskyi]
MRARADADIEAAIAYTRTAHSPTTALALLDALEQAFVLLGEQPGVGSPRYAELLDLPGLRVWSLSGYPYLVCYLERADHLDIWRVLHAKRDIPTSLRDPDSEIG